MKHETPVFRFLVSLSATPGSTVSVPVVQVELEFIRRMTCQIKDDYGIFYASVSYRAFHACETEEVVIASDGCSSSFLLIDSCCR